MTTIYLVSSGSYSDYSVHAAFTTEALAQEYIDKWKSFGVDEYDIEERDLDPDHELNIPFQKGWSLFLVTMFKNGNSDIKKIRPYGAYKENDNAQESLGRNYIPEKGWTEEVVLGCSIWAPDIEGAAKIANEKRTRLIATGEWDAKEKELKKEMRKNHR